VTFQQVPQPLLVLGGEEMRTTGRPQCRHEDREGHDHSEDE
jgi:hypothetical protein